jgi:tRNA pseudouridine55 synthase
VKDADLRNAAGVYVVDKPAGITSFDVVRRLKRGDANLRMGHTGTLDPLATGVLAVCVGEATKLVSYMQLEPKQYRGSMQLGLLTDTWDVTGNLLERRAVPSLPVEALRLAFREQEGMQVLEPPAFSAIKHRGRPLYTYARKGQFVQKPPRKALIEAFHLLGAEEDVLEFELTCSRGTYVRSVVHAIGKRLGCGACVRSPRRLRCGRFCIEDALPLDRLEELVRGNRQQEVLIPPADVLDHLEACEIREQSVQKLCQGSPLRKEDLRHADRLGARIGQRFRIMAQGGLAAVAEARQDLGGVFLQPIRVLLRAA